MRLRPAQEALQYPEPIGSLPVRRSVLEAARTISREGLVVGTVGNVSVRIDDAMLITPTRLPYEQMGVDDLVAVSLAGEVLEGRHAASREIPLHLAVYERRPDVAALVHTHSPHATAWSFLGEPLLPCTADNEYYGIGPVRTNPPAPSGSAELARTAALRLADSPALLLGRHGVLTAAGGLGRAVDVARAVEHQAQVAWILRKGSAQGSQ